MTSLLWAQEMIPRIQGSEPIEITADQLEYLQDQDRLIAEGSVQITRGDFKLTSDYAELDNPSQWLTAVGNVEIFDAQSHSTADEVKYNLKTGEATLYQGKLFVKKENLSFKSDKIEKLPDGRYRFGRGSLTTCSFKEGKCPLWQFRARHSRLRLGHYLVARDVVFKIKGVPVFYLPYLIVPVKTERQTGFLAPVIGYNTTGGLMVTEDFFWVIAPNQDATFSLDHQSHRGIGGRIEYRYRLDRKSGGTMTTRYFNDRIEDLQRLEGKIKHRQVFTQDFQARLDAHLVSDTQQFRDLSQVTEERVQKSLESKFIVYHRWDKQYLYLLARYTRNLLSEGDLTIRKEPVQRFPEVGYHLMPFSIANSPFYFEFKGTGTSFWLEEEQEDEGLIRAQRLDIFPRIIGRFNWGGLVITPRWGWRETWYSKRLQGDTPVRRKLGLLDIGANMRLTKVLRNTPENKVMRLLHSVEPAVVYEYIPNINQDDLPKYDEIDEFPAKNLITYSLTNRLVGYFKGKDESMPVRREALMLKVTQSYDIRKKHEENDEGLTRPFSNIRGELTLRPMAGAQFDVDSIYNPHEREPVTVHLDLKIRPHPIVFLSIGQRHTREDAVFPRGDVLNPFSQSDEVLWYTGNAPMVRFYTSHIRLNFPFGLRLANRIYYDAEVEEFAEINYGLQYNGQCWGLIVSYIDLPEENQVSFMITIKTASASQSNALMSLF